MQHCEIKLTFHCEKRIIKKKKFLDFSNLVIWNKKVTDECCEKKQDPEWSYCIYVQGATTNHPFVVDSCIDFELYPLLIVTTLTKGSLSRNGLYLESLLSWAVTFRLRHLSSLSVCECVTLCVCVCVSVYVCMCVAIFFGLYFGNYGFAFDETW